MQKSLSKTVSPARQTIELKKYSFKPIKDEFLKFKDDIVQQQNVASVLERPITWRMYDEQRRNERSLLQFATWQAGSFYAAHKSLQLAGVSAALSNLSIMNFGFGWLATPMSFALSYPIASMSMVLAVKIGLLSQSRVPTVMFGVKSDQFYESSPLSKQSAQAVVEIYGSQITGSSKIAWDMLLKRLDQKGDTAADVGRIYATVQQLVPYMVDCDMTLSGMMRKDPSFKKYALNMFTGGHRKPLIKSRLLNKVGYLTRSLKHYRISRQVQQRLIDAKVFKQSQTVSRAFLSDKVDTTVTIADVQEMLVHGAGLPLDQVQVRDAQLEEILDAYLNFAVQLQSLSDNYQTKAVRPYYQVIAHDKQASLDFPDRVKALTASVKVSSSEDKINWMREYKNFEKDNYQAMYKFKDRFEVPLPVPKGKIMTPLDLTSSAFLLARSLIVSRYN